MRIPTFLILSVASVLAFSISDFSQIAVPGQVVDVLDAKTVVISVAAGDVAVELQYIEVPPAEQPMHSSIKKHLRDLVLGKRVEYYANQITYDRTVGRLISDNIDISQQMLRDGAGWHVPLAISGQDRSGFAEYDAFEAAAKQEKRGVWADASLKPSWDEAYVAPERAAAEQRSTLVAVPHGYWSDPNPRLGNIGALQHGYNAASKHGYVGIPLMGVSDPNAFEKEYKTGVDLIYFYTEGTKGRTGYFAITIISMSAKLRFQQRNTLTGYADGERFVMGVPKRVARKEGGTYYETLTYQVSRSSIERLANATYVGIEAGDYPMIMHPGLQMILNNLLEVSR
jgi:endonuclease YncB( thermonuclease family)